MYRVSTNYIYGKSYFKLNLYFRCGAAIEYVIEDEQVDITNIISVFNNTSAEVKISTTNIDFSQSSIVVVESLPAEDLNLFLVSANTQILSFGVVNVTAFKANGEPIFTFEEPVEICLSVPPDTDKDEACLSFLNEDNEWECEDKCLDREVNERGDTLLCGSTGHFTTFSILFTGIQNDCNNNDSPVDTAIAWLSFGLICFAIIFVAFGVIMIEIRYRKNAAEVEKLMKNARESRIMALNNPTTQPKI